MNKTLSQKKFKYQIVEELGKGGMGCVYKAFDPDMNKYVALKTILVDRVSQKDMERFLREAKAMAQMNYPNIVKIYTIGEEENHPYFAMEYIQGVTLAKLLQNTSLSTRFSSELMVKIAKAITYAHKMGIIHRDLKPANIMIDQNNQPYVVDFGLAKLVEAEKSLFSKGAIMGTPQYMSPQQACGEQLNHLTDIYSLGAIFYEMLAAKPLTEGENANDILYKIIHHEPALLRKINKALSRDLETICHKAIVKELDKRYQSAQAFAEDIERFLQGEIIQAKAASIWEIAWNRVKRNKLIATVTVVGALLIFVGTFAFKNYQRVDISQHLAKAKGLEQKAKEQKNIEKQMQIYLELNNLLEKTLETVLDNFQVKRKLVETKETLGELAKEQKNYLLSFALFKQCKNLGYPNADILLTQLEQKRDQLKVKHRRYIVKIMEKISSKTPQELIDRYVFNIIKMQRPYVVALLIPYLNNGNKWQRLLAIKALGKFGNRYTKFQKKDSVEWLLSSLKKFKTREQIENNQEVEKIIWALGWLKDKRANELVYEKRLLVGQNSLLWIKTEIPYRWIPMAKISAENAKQLVKRGLMKCHKGDYTGAIADYSKAISLNPEFLEAYNNRGNAYYKIKEYDKAIADYAKTIALNPKSSEAYNNRGISYNKIKEYDKAIVDHTKAIALNPKSSLAHNNRGIVYKEIKEYNKAIVDYTKAIALNPKYLGAYYNRGIVYLEIKEHDKAIVDYSKAITINPRNSTLYIHRGNLYMYFKQYQKGYRDYQTFLQLTPNHSLAPNVNKAIRNLKNKNLVK